MDIKFIKNIAEQNPAFARAINIGILSCVAYMLGVVVQGNSFTIQGLLQMLLIPLLAYIDKLLRDAKK